MIFSVLILNRKINMSRDTVDGGLTLTGTITWFYLVKGFGFIVSDEKNMDILLHANVLRNFWQGSIAGGFEIKVIAYRSDQELRPLRSCL